MVPTALITVARFPLTPNGKSDRKALPVPDMAALQADYVAPGTDIEHALCEIWQEVLGVERVGVTDNFFRLGGHSLMATRFMSRINKLFDVVLPLKTLFSEQSISNLTQVLLASDSGMDHPVLVSVAREGNLLLSYAQQRLWLLDQIDGGSAHYNIASGLKLSGILDQQALNYAFSTVVERHESLRTYFVAGENGEPYQVIQPVCPFTATVQDISLLEEVSRQQKLTALINEEAARVFDLSADLMFRVHLIKVADDEHLVLVTMHHIAPDAWSIAIVVNEFCALYRAYVQGQDTP